MFSLQKVKKNIRCLSCFDSQDFYLNARVFKSSQDFWNSWLLLVPSIRTAWMPKKQRKKGKARKTCMAWTPFLWHHGRWTGWCLLHHVMSAVKMVY
jgi:hypothetical protein